MKSPEPPPLPSDELGDVGEAKFKLLCARAVLVANKADRDRFGWDYVVQAQAAGQADAPLDARVSHTTAFVQVKATWRGTKARISLTLSSAEKLAKHGAASFIVGLAFDRRGEDDCDIHVIEMRGAPLAKVLKRLREVQKDAQRPLNEATITFPLTAENRLAHATPEALKARLTQGFAKGEAAYVAAKDRESRTLGYEDGRYQFTFVVDADQPFETVEFLLGEREIKGALVRPLETRFGIALPSTFIPTGEGAMKFKAEPIGICRLKVSGSSLKKALIFDGHYFHASLPGPKGLVWKARAEFGLFNVVQTSETFGLNGDMSVKDTRKRTIAEWIDFHRLAVAHCADDIQFSLRAPHRVQPLLWTFQKRPDELGDFQARLDLFETACSILREARREHEPVSAKAVYGHQKAIYAAAGFTLPEARRVQIGFRRELEEEESLAPMTRLYVGAIDFGTFRLAHAARVLLTPTDREDGRYWFTGPHHPIALEAISISPEDFRDFVEEAKQASEVDDVLLDELDLAFLNQALGDVGAF
jgi:hypothetical protein